MNKSFASRALSFFNQLDLPQQLPEDIIALNPYKETDVMEVCASFYHKYYNDSHGRTLILGINPGRFGAGITGIPFTDPVKLNDPCGIENPFAKRAEMSSDFIYRLIDADGGPKEFYSKYFIGSVSPLGFTQYGKNFNYYDSKSLKRVLKPFIIEKLVQQIGLGINSRDCYVLGQGKNLEYLMELNQELKLFDKLIPLPHPRWVMQYRRKQLDDYIQKTLEVLD